MHSLFEVLAKLALDQKFGMWHHRLACEVFPGPRPAFVAHVEVHPAGKETRTAAVLLQCPFFRTTLVQLR